MITLQGSSTGLIAIVVYAVFLSAVVFLLRKARFGRRDLPRPNPAHWHRWTTPNGTRVCACGEDWPCLDSVPADRKKARR